MKKFIVVLLLLNSYLAQAGEVISKKTGERMHLELDRNSKKLFVTYTPSTGTDELHKTITLKDYKKAQEKGIELLKTKPSLTSDCGPCGPADGNPQILFRLSNDINETTKETFNHVLVGYLIPGYNVVMLAANLIDTIALPFNISKKMIRNSYVKKDLKVLNALLNSDESSEISSKQFDRLFYYFLFNERYQNY